MRYLSTRGHAVPQSFCDILLGGLAPDGGLYLPESYPQISRGELDAWRKLSYANLAYEILSKFITDIPAADLKALVAKTYTAQVYCHTRNGGNAAEITPLTKLEDGLYTQELSNGPTLAFKDMAMQLLGNLFEYVLDKRGESINILGATSGDTGSAAEYAMRGKHNVKVFMLSPDGKMSAFQRAQMYSLQDANIFNIAVTGLFDDAQDIVKAVSNDAAFKAKYKIGAVNSINWARVAAQIVYYFQGYFLATKSNDEQVAFAVPSGNFGNICAGHIARQMGLPIARLVLATNENDVLDEFFRSGVYRPRSSAETSITSSPSMDISKASNFERFVFDLVGRDPAVVAELWAKVDKGQAFDLNATVHWKNMPNSDLYPARAPMPTACISIAHGPAKIWRDARYPYRRRLEGRARTSPAQRADDCSRNRPAGQVRGNHPRGPGHRAGTPGRSGRHREAAAARRGDGARCRGRQTLHRRTRVIVSRR
jgi:threonine synthase